MSEISLERQNSICSEGTHTFKIVKSEEKMGGSGFPYWNFQMTCIDEGPDKGQSVWGMISLSPQARFKLDQFLDATNAPTKGSASHEHFVGQTLRATVKWEDYNGKISAKPDAFIPAGGGSTLPKSASVQKQAQSSGQSLPNDVAGGSVGFKPPF